MVLIYNNNAGELVSAKGQGSYLHAAEINGFQIYPSSGNLVTGTITLIGMN
jgi:hypothetical protein